MYVDSRPCATCGSEVELRAKDPAQLDDGTDGVVGPADGVVGTADVTPDARICSNPECPTNVGRGEP